MCSRGQESGHGRRIDVGMAPALGMPHQPHAMPDVTPTSGAPPRNQCRGALLCALSQPYDTSIAGVVTPIPTSHMFVFHPDLRPRHDARTAPNPDQIRIKSGSNPKHVPTIKNRAAAISTWPNDRMVLRMVGMGRTAVRPYIGFGVVRRGWRHARHRVGLVWHSQCRRHTNVTWGSGRYTGRWCYIRHRGSRVAFRFPPPPPSPDLRIIRHHHL